MQQFCKTSSIFELDNPKRRNSARLPQFELDNNKNKAVLRDVLQKWKVECRADGLVPMRFAIIPVHVSKVLRLPRKSEASSNEVLHLSRKIISAKPKDLMLQNATSLRKSAPGPPNSSDEHVSCTAPATENASCQILFKCPTPAIIFEMLENSHVLLTFDKGCPIPCACHAKRHLNVKKWSENVVFVYNILTSKSASRHNSVRFFDITASKSAPSPSVLWHFWIRDVLRATTACIFSTSQVPKVVRAWCALCILTWKRASRHNGVHFFDISTSVLRHWGVLYILTWKCASHHNRVQLFISHPWLRTRRFSEPTFRPSGATNHCSELRLSYLFAQLHFFLLALSLSLTFPTSAFPICPYCRKFDF